MDPIVQAAQMVAGHLARTPEDWRRVIDAANAMLKAAGAR